MTSRRVRAKNEFDGIAPFDDPLAVPVPERSSGKVTGDGFL
ncbi:MAG: hypothetical protein P8J37_23345 [Fuerstiella sp.]|nr:hypothetical protein [Fuerstiella sp.]